jgi:tetratricopeptide (TPR) repeat protein
MQKNEEREKNFFEFWNNIPLELKIQKEIEYYDKVLQLHNFYRDIWYKLGLVYNTIGNKQKAKEYFHKSEQVIKSEQK